MRTSLASVSKKSFIPMDLSFEIVNKKLFISELWGSGYAVTASENIPLIIEALRKLENNQRVEGGLQEMSEPIVSPT